MAKKNEIVDYVKSHCAKELEEVRRGPIANTESTLTIEERTLIYKYTEDGYSTVNETLRESTGATLTQFGTLLDKTLKKLPNYNGLAYRSVNLTERELERYIQALQNNLPIVEHSFISTSKSALIGDSFGKNCRFRIISRTGKEIETFAKYGCYSGQNEKEVLFRPNRRFSILEITKKVNVTLIVIEEVN